MSSTALKSAEQSKKKETHLDFLLKPDVDIDRIAKHMTCGKFRDAAWGFVVRPISFKASFDKDYVYRCTEGDDTAFNRFLQALRDEVEESLRFYLREDLLPAHDLHVIDKKELHGATSHQIRDHFRSWVPRNLESRLRPGEKASDDDIEWVYATSTPRYEYCLFFDDICSESWGCASQQVAKLLCKSWESPYPVGQRGYRVPEPLHDGVTDYDEEDVGWMYMPLGNYLYKYSLLTRGDWDEQYVRPPYIDGDETEDNMVGHWRRNVSK